MSINDEALLVQTFGHLPHFRQSGREWKSACPQCGDAGHSGPGLPDRFFMNLPDGAFDCVRGKCRRCGYSQVVGKEEADVDPKWRREMMKDHQIRADEQDRKQKEFASSGLVERYYNQMTFAQRQYWNREGISDASIKRYKLGFTEDKEFGPKDNRFRSDAMTIPIWTEGWKPANVQYRLMTPPTDGGKYRTIYGLGLDLFLTLPEDPIEGTIVVVEGAKKAIVLAERLWSDGAMTNVVAVPSKMPGRTLVKKLARAERIFLCLDPDAYPQDADRLAEDMLRENDEQDIFLVELPFKPDDFFVRYDGTVNNLRRYFKESTYARYQRPEYKPLFK